jgi:t-SNARE complex subunit (syntaxin)
MQRNQDINQIGEIMANLNDMARDLAIETRAQGEKLNKLHENIEVAEKNVDDAHEQLKQAAGHQRRAGKCTKCLVILILLLLISVALIIYFNYIK